MVNKYYKDWFLSNTYYTKLIKDPKTILILNLRSFFKLFKNLEPIKVFDFFKNGIMTRLEEKN